MNIEAQMKLQLYMFRDGNTHPAVSVFKIFLNSSLKTPVDNLKTDNTFDGDTKKSLANFQRNVGLSPTGRMNIQTWLAIGAEMNPVQIKRRFDVGSNGSGFAANGLSFKIFVRQA